MAREPFLHRYTDLIISGVRLHLCWCLPENVSDDPEAVYSLAPAGGDGGVERDAERPVKRARLEQEGRSRPGGGGGGKARFLTEEMESEILRRLPAGAAARSKSVCQRWGKLMGHPSFLHLHAEHRFEADPCVLIWPFRDSSPIRDILPSSPRYRIGLFACKLPGVGGATGLSAPLLLEADIECLHEVEDNFVLYTLRQPLMRSRHCDGVVLFTTNENVIACNPTTGEFVVLPPSPRGLLTVPRFENPRACQAALCRDPLTGDYKVVKCFLRSYWYRKRIFNMGCEILTLGGGPGALSWRATKDDPPYSVRFDTIVSCEGAIYWMIRDDLESLPPQIIVSLDLRGERFTMISAPPGLSPYNHAKMASKTLLRNIGGKLCLVYSPQGKGSFDIWMLSDRVNQVWTMKYRIRLPPDDLPIDFMELPRRRVLAVMTKRGISYYDPRTNTLEEAIDVLDKLIYCHPQRGDFVSKPGVGGCQMCFYAESLVSIKGNTGSSVMRRLPRCIPF
uniref:F-box protein At5g18160 n=1 Tax=Anthurium amnicola TaxID=1678845 RepID=A0A1D1YV18_9ARAE